MKLRIIVISCAIALTASSAAQASKLYKWVDKNGNISYQDQPPPKGSKVLQETTTEPDRLGSANKKLSPVKIYTADNCNVCAKVASHLRSNNIPMIEIPLHSDRDAQSRILERSDSLIVPTIFVGNQMLQGGDLSSLDRALEKDGYPIAKEPDKTRNQQLLDAPEQNTGEISPLE